MEEKNYSSFSNLKFIIHEIKDFDLWISVCMSLEVIMNIIVAFAGILLPTMIIRMIENKSDWTSIITSLLVMTAIFSIIYFSHDYIKNRNTWQYTEFRAGFLMRKMMKAATRMPYDKYCDSKTQERFTAAIDCINTNTQGIERIIFDLSALLTALLSMTLYLVAFGVVQPVLVAIILVSSVAQILVFNSANRFAYENMMPKSNQEINMNYLNRQAVDIGAAKDIRLFQMQDWLIHMYENSNRIFGQIVKSERHKYFVADVCGLVMDVIASFICYIYLFLKLKEGMSVSTFVLYAGIIQVLSACAKTVPEVFSEMSRYLKEFSICRSFLEFSNSIKGEEQSVHSEVSKCKISFSNVSFSYPGSKRKILDNVSFTIEPGAKIALVGENGAGKTTIISLICGFFKPTSGDIYINDVNTKDLSPLELRSMICTVFQDSVVTGFSIAENVACESSENIDWNKLHAALDKTTLTQKIALLDKKEETYIGKVISEDGINLSGGELQKLFISRALYADRGVLLLDEPTAALDAITEKEIYEDYHKLCKDKTTLFISHRLASTRFCDEIWLLKDGKIVEKGTHDELMDMHGDYAALYDIQSKYYLQKIA